MDQQAHGHQQVTGVVSTAALPYGANSYEQNQMTGTPGRGSVLASVGNMQSTGQPAGAQLAQHHLAYQHIHQQQQQQLQQQLQSFWAGQYQEIEKVTDFKNHSLPLARIKKIMKADEDVRMISAEAPIVFARACEMFILELTCGLGITLRKIRGGHSKRMTSQRQSHELISLTFLVDIVPREDPRDEALASMPRGTLPVGGPADALPCYYMPAQHSPQAGTPGMMMGKPVMDPALYAQQPYPYMAQQMWPQAPQQPQSPSDS